jgi:hypothetical protein
LLSLKAIEARAAAWLLPPKRVRSGPLPSSGSKGVAPGLTEAQRLALTRAIFEEALRDLRRDIKDIVTSVLEQYGLLPPSRRAKPIAALAVIAGSR